MAFGHPPYAPAAGDAPSGESTSEHRPSQPAADVLSDEQLLAISNDVANVILLARTLDVDDVAVWATVARRQLERMDTLTSLLDPTGWQRDRRGVAATADVASAFLAFRRAIEQAAA